MIAPTLVFYLIRYVGFLPSVSWPAPSTFLTLSAPDRQFLPSTKLTVNSVWDIDCKNQVGYSHK